LREGDPSDYIALIKHGEFEIIKQDLREVDDRLLEFLRKVDEKKVMTSFINLSRGS
jgi:CRP-like cAMP-binding protein